MTQVDAKTLDYSVEMKAYFDRVTEILTSRFDKSPKEANALVDRFFALEVNPLERAFVMHTEAEIVAEDLAKSA